MELIFISNIASTVIRVGISLILILQGYGLFELVLVILFSYLISVAACFIMFQRYIGKIIYKIDFGATWTLIKDSPSFVFITIVGMISARIDVLIIAKLTEMVQVAIYSAAYKLLEMSMTLPIAYLRATFPQVSRLYKSDLSSFQEMNSKILRNIFYYVLFTAIAIVVLASLIIHIFYGDKFTNSSNILQMLVIGLLPWGAGRVYASILCASNLQRYDLVANIFAAGANFLLNIILIPRYGVMGAAIANSSSLFVFFVLEYWFVRKNVYSISMIEILKQAVLIGALGLVAIFVARTGWLFPFIALLILLFGIIFYTKRKSNIRQEFYSILTLLKNIMNS
jgi:O-antigen/teichoic acid export membrane protein